MHKNRRLSLLLIIVGIIVLFTAFVEGSVQMSQPQENSYLSTQNGVTVYTYNVTLSDSSVLTVINATGSYGLVPSSDLTSALQGSLSAYAVGPSNSTGTYSPNLTYTGISGHYVFVEKTGSGYPPFVLIAGNGLITTIAGLISIGSFLLIIGGVFIYPFKRRNVPVVPAEPVKEEQ